MNIETLRGQASELYQKAQTILSLDSATDEQLTEAKGYLDEVDSVRGKIEIMEKAEAVGKTFTQPATQLPTAQKAAGITEIKERTAEFKSFGEQLQAIVRATTNQGVDPRLNQKSLGLNEGVGSEGGFLVQQDFAAEIIRIMHQEGQLMQRVRRIPISANSNGIKIPAVDETSRANGSRWGGVTSHWLKEGGTKLSSNPSFRMISMSLKKLIGLCYSTDELLQDATALNSIVTQAFSEELTFRIEEALVRGSGAGQPLGFLNSPALVVVAKEAGQAADTIVFENITNMWSRMWAPSRANSVWLINQSIEAQLASLALNVGTGGSAAYLPANGLADSPFSTLYGRPIIPMEQMSALGDEGDIALIDPTQILMIEKGGMQTATSIHIQFTTDETAFRVVWRTDSQPIWNSALTPFASGAPTLSPYVTLAERA